MLQFIKKMLAQILSKQPSGRVESFINELVRGHVASLSPEEALKFLFRLDHCNYMLEGAKSVEYGGGEHTKHRHMKYHDFFTDRITPSETVMDIGCGIGALAKSIAEKSGASVIGVDINEDNINKAGDCYSHPKVKYLVGDATEKLPIDKCTVVVLSNVLEHIEKRIEFLGKIIRNINPDRILIRVPLFERDWRVPLKKELGVEWRLDMTHETEYTIESFEREMADSQLSILHREVRWGEIWAETEPIVR